MWLGFSFSVFAFFGFSLIHESWMLWPMLIPAALGGFLDPSMHGIMANQTNDNAQGELQGAISSLTSVASIIGPVSMTQMFAMFTGANLFAGFYLPGAPFFAAAVLMMIAAIPIAAALTHLNSQQR